MKINVLIVDDDKLISESLKIILSNDERINIIGISDNGKDAVDICKREQVDIALMDIRMPSMNGIDATKEIVTKTNTKILILTTFDDDEYVSKAIEYGAKGYLLKSNKPEVIINSIISVYLGSAVIQEQLMDKLTVKEKKRNKLQGVTEREKTIIIKISEGKTNKEIAEELFLSEGTIKNNITSILSKLHLKHRTQIAIYYLK